MRFSSRLDQIHSQARQNRWLWFFSIFCRIALVFGFIPSGIVKITGERFASGLSINHPMGHYLEALHTTGYYYTFIGIVQLIAAILILIPRTVLLGALIYLPIILNICILSFAVRFEGSLVTSPLMVLANLYVLFWNYDRLKFILPFHQTSTSLLTGKPEKLSNKFPTLFFTGVIVSIGLIVLYARFGHAIMPRNSLKDCKSQLSHADNDMAVDEFCECIHTQGRSLEDCLDEYDKAR